MLVGDGARRWAHGRGFKDAPQVSAAGLFLARIRFFAACLFLGIRVITPFGGTGEGEGGLEVKEGTTEDSPHVIMICIMCLLQYDPLVSGLHT
jgi:hypothetical protein